MPDDGRRESADLTDYEVRDASDTLNGPPGDDPLDQGVVTPDRWSAGIRRGLAAADAESLDEQLAEEEPDVVFDRDAGQAGDFGGDENATEEDIARLRHAQGPNRRAGRLLAEAEGLIEDDEVSVAARDDFLARAAPGRDLGRAQRGLASAGRADATSSGR